VGVDEVADDQHASARQSGVEWTGRRQRLTSNLAPAVSPHLETEREAQIWSNPVANDLRLSKINVGFSQCYLV